MQRKKTKKRPKRKKKLPRKKKRLRRKKRRLPRKMKRTMTMMTNLQNHPNLTNLPRNLLEKKTKSLLKLLPNLRKRRRKKNSKK